MRIMLLKLWDTIQPVLRKPRWWTASVLRRFLGRTTFIAITGSNGKSTATRILAAILSSYASTQWTRLNRNAEAGITETIAFCNPWKTRFALFEIAAGKPGQVRKLAGLVRPHIAVVLSVFLEHRYTLRTLKGVAREKAELLAMLQHDGVAVINADDPLVAAMPVPPGRKIIRFGASPDNDVYYEDVRSAWPEMLRFTAVVHGQRQEIRTRLLGTHWAGSVLACIAVADYLGIPLERIARVIEGVPPYPGRMQVVRLPSGVIVVRDEFKGSAHTVAAAFEELRKAKATRKILVFCDMADTARTYSHRLGRTGASAAELFDYTIFIGEKAYHGVHGARKGGLPEDRALAFADYLAAAEFLKPLLRPGDVVLLKADRDKQLSRLFFSLLGTVKCTVPSCPRNMVCDDCREHRNLDLVQLANEQLTVGAD